MPEHPYLRSTANVLRLASFALLKVANFDSPFEIDEVGDDQDHVGWRGVSEASRRVGRRRLRRGSTHRHQRHYGGHQGPTHQAVSGHGSTPGQMPGFSYPVAVVTLGQYRRIATCLRIGKPSGGRPAAITTNLTDRYGARQVRASNA